MPALSVIVVAHNEERDLARAVESVLAQNWQDFELIIVDDASTDRTWQIIQSFSDPRIVRHQRLSARGAGAARNAAIALAQAEYIAFLDADDCWHQDKLVQQMAALAENDAVLCGFRLFRQNNPAPEFYLHNLPARWPQGIVTGCHFSPGSGLLIKKSCFEHVGGFDEDLRRLEDWDWWLRAAPHVTCGNLPTALMDIHMGAAPSYAVVMESCHQIGKKHFTAIMQRFGAPAAWQFHITLEFECAAAAFHERCWLAFFLRMARGAVLHPRLWQRLLRLRS